MQQKELSYEIYKKKVIPEETRDLPRMTLQL